MACSAAPMQIARFVGHAPKTVTDEYSKVKSDVNFPDVNFPREVAEKVAVGFNLERRRKAKKQTLSQEFHAIQKAVLAKLSDSDPSILGEPDAPVYAPLKPKPHLRSGAIAIPEPEPEDAFVALEAKRISK